MTQFFPQWTVSFTATNRKPFALSIHDTMGLPWPCCCWRSMACACAKKAGSRSGVCAGRTPRFAAFKQHFLNFLPLPHGHGSFLPVFIFGVIAESCRWVTPYSRLVVRVRLQRDVSNWPDSDEPKFSPSDSYRAVSGPILSVSHSLAS